MHIPTASRIPAQYFVRHPDLNSFSADASELRGFTYVGRLVGPGDSLGFELSTGSDSISFVLARVERVDGDLVAWHYRALGDPALTAVVFND